MNSRVQKRKKIEEKKVRISKINSETKERVKNRTRIPFKKV